MSAERTCFCKSGVGTTDMRTADIRSTDMRLNHETFGVRIVCVSLRLLVINVLINVKL